MPTMTVWPKIEEGRIAQALDEAGEKLDSAGGDIVLDFSSVRKLDIGAVQAMEELARIAAEKGVKVVLRGVNVDVHKVLTLLKLKSRFSFVN
jgi:anti-anti-sigma regulatory factor